MKKIAFVSLMACLLQACQSTPTPAPRYVPELMIGEPIIVSIDKTRINCNSTRPMQCMPITDANHNTLYIPYNAIDGFVPQTHREYKLSISPYIDRNHGQPTGFYVLNEILSQY